MQFIRVICRKIKMAIESLVYAYLLSTAQIDSKLRSQEEETELKTAKYKGGKIHLNKE